MEEGVVREGKRNDRQQIMNAHRMKAIRSNRIHVHIFQLYKDEISSLSVASENMGKMGKKDHWFKAPKILCEICKYGDALTQETIPGF